MLLSYPVFCIGHFLFPPTGRGAPGNVMAGRGNSKLCKPPPCPFPNEAIALSYALVNTMMQ
jgi:hypothetical protein